MLITSVAEVLTIALLRCLNEGWADLTRLTSILSQWRGSFSPNLDRRVKTSVFAIYPIHVICRASFPDSHSGNASTHLIAYSRVRVDFIHSFIRSFTRRKTVSCSYGC